MLFTWGKVWEIRETNLTDTAELRYWRHKYVAFEVGKKKLSDNLNLEKYSIMTMALLPEQSTILLYYYYKLLQTLVRTCARGTSTVILVYVWLKKSSDRLQRNTIIVLYNRKIQKHWNYFMSTRFQYVSEVQNQFNICIQHDRANKALSTPRRSAK